MARVVKVELHRERVVAALRAEGFLVTEWSDDAKADYSTHSHADREVRVVLTGEMTFVVESKTLVLGPGDRIDLEPGEAHSARVGPSGATYLAGSARRMEQSDPLR